LSQTYRVTLDFWLYLGNKKSYRRSPGVKTTEFSGAVKIFKNLFFCISEFQDFKISVFFYFWLYLGNKKSYPRFAGVKPTKFLGLFKFWKEKKKLGFLYFFGFLTISQQRKELPEIRCCKKKTDFRGLFRFLKENLFQFFCILFAFLKNVIWS